MIHEALVSFFKEDPKQDARNYSRYILVEEEGEYFVCASACDLEDPGKSSISISYNEDNEMRLVWHKDHQPVVTVQSIGISKVVAVKEGEEESLQFVLERMPSRMIKVQLKPFFAIDMSMYWEVCEECD
ncbi:MAG: DUF3979 family protein [Ectobacillus sp.]